MNVLWGEVREGWREARWLLYFCLMLVPVTLAAFFIGHTVEGRPVHPGPITLALASGGALLCFLAAGIIDGPTGKLGNKVWFSVLIVGFAILVWRAIRRPGEPLGFEWKLAGHTLHAEGCFRAAAEQPALPPDNHNRAGASFNFVWC